MSKLSIGQMTITILSLSIRRTESAQMALFAIVVGNLSKEKVICSAEDSRSNYDQDIASGNEEIAMT